MCKRFGDTVLTGGHTERTTVDSTPPHRREVAVNINTEKKKITAVSLGGKQSEATKQNELHSRIREVDTTFSVDDTDGEKHRKKKKKHYFYVQYKLNNLP